MLDGSDMMMVAESLQFSALSVCEWHCIRSKGMEYWG